MVRQNQNACYVPSFQRARHGLQRPDVLIRKCARCHPRGLRLSSWRRFNPASRSVDSSRPVLARLGGADRDRTGDPLLAKQVLSQLSYSPTNGTAAEMVGLGRVELPTSRLSGVRAGEPETTDGPDWWAREDLNFRPHAYQARALTS